MKLHLNGSLVELDPALAPTGGPLTISALLSLHKLKPETVVVEHNRLVPPKSEYDTLVIRDGDQVEIVKFMGGG